MLNEILSSTTKTEIFLLITTITFLALWLAKSNVVRGLTFHLMDARSHASQLYSMYIQLSNNVLDITHRWQKCEAENKELLKQIHSKES